MTLVYQVQVKHLHLTVELQTLSVLTNSCSYLPEMSSFTAGASQVLPTQQADFQRRLVLAYLMLLSFSTNPTLTQNSGSHLW